MFEATEFTLEALQKVEGFLIVRAWEDEDFKQHLFEHPSKVIYAVVEERTGAQISNEIDFLVDEAISDRSSETGYQPFGFDFEIFNNASKRVKFYIPPNPNQLLSRQETKSELIDLSGVFACKTSEVSDCDETETVSCNTSTWWVFKCCKDDD